MYKYFFILSATLASTIAHSWVGCTQYMTNDTNYLTFGNFDRSKCYGYPRGFKTQYNAEVSNGWGADSGFDSRQMACRSEYTTADYSDTIPMAIYTAGSVIHISHPAKNHVADVCTNEFIPSTSLYLQMSSKTKDDTFDLNLTMIGPDHQDRSIDHRGFQNCYRFCDNMDRSHCITSWNIPEVVDTGRHSFRWVWVFNPDEIYVTCFDALIIASQHVPTPVVSTPMPIASPANTPNATTIVPTTAPSATTDIVPTTSPMPIITSDANQLTSAISQLLQTMKFKIDGIFNITFT